MTNGFCVIRSHDPRCVVPKQPPLVTLDAPAMCSESMLITITGHIATINDGD